jgi:galactose mutarotase-like enzyme
VYTLENDRLRIQIQRKGAELCSVLALETGTEYLWNADPSVWNSHAPVLFPIIGCLKEGYYFYQEKRYSVPKHGFIRHNDGLLAKMESPTSVSFSLRFDAESLVSYPFQFDFLVRFTLLENSIVVEHEICNLDGKDPLYFSLGGHPAFKCPINDNDKYEDCFLEFEKKENADTWNVLPNGLIDSSSQPLLENSNRLQLHNGLHNGLFKKDALILKNLQSKRVRLRSKRSPEGVTVEYSDFCYLGLWAKPGANFLCIEPWLGISDSVDSDQNFEKKEGILCLKPKARFNASYTITIH